MLMPLILLGLIVFAIFVLGLLVLAVSFYRADRKSAGWVCGLAALGLLYGVLLVGMDFYAWHQFGPSEPNGWLYVWDTFDPSMAGYPPEEPRPKGASQFVIYAKHIPGVGYEKWGRFEFESREDYELYYDAVTKLNGIRTSATAEFWFPDSPPEEAHFIVTTETIRSPIRARCLNEEWIFDPDNLSVYTLEYD